MFYWESVSVLYRPHILHNIALIDKPLHQLYVKLFCRRVVRGEGETHLSEEHRKDSQADPVDDTGKLEGIINCKERKEWLLL